MGAACAITVGVFVRVTLVPARSLSAIEQLVSLSNERVSDGRFTGGFRFAAGTTTRSRADAAALSNDTLSVIANMEKAAASPSSRTTDLHALAIARSVQHRYVEAESILQNLTTIAANADVWSDLAAVQLSEGEPQDIARALGAAERALQQSPKHSEALFNRALAIERLKLRPQAVSAWQAYLVIDTVSPWADDARAHVARLTNVHAGETLNVRDALLAALEADDPSQSRRLVAESPQEVRDLLEDEIMSQWASRAATSVTAMPPAGRAMAALVSAITERTGDPLLQESVNAFEAAPRGVRPVLRNAHTAYERARVLYERYAFSEATPLFRSAGEAMKRHHDPFWRWCAFYAAAIAYQQNDLRRARAGLERLDVESHRYGAVGARIAWLRGIVAASWGNFDEAFSHYRRALQFFEKVGERDNIAAVHSLLADNYLLLGAERQAWESQFKALSVDLGSLRARRQQLVAFTAMQAAIRSGSPEAALYFNSVFIDSAVAAHNVAAAAEGHVHRARLYYRLQDCARARASLRDASTQLSGAERSGSVDFLRAQMLLAEASTPQCEASRDRLTALSSAVDIFRGATRTLWLPRALLARARELRRLGRPSEAGVDLQDGIEILERSAGALNSATLRIEYTDDVWDLFDEMIDLKLASGLAAQAWDFAERGHVQASRHIGAALGVRDVAVRLPAGHALAYYVFTKTQAVLFLFDRGGFTLHRLRSAATTLGERIRTFTDKLQRGEDDAATRQLAEQLYDDLLAEAVDGLPDDTRIHVVADGPLHQLPFHALKARGDARYLFERFLISNAPSATSLLTGRRRASRVGSSEPVVVFGDPAGDDLGTPLPRLPHAAQEASTVAGLYDRSRLYLGEQATRDVFLHRLSTARIVHLAGHAVVDERHPELSRLILAAPASGGPRYVLMRELADVPLPHTRLVVLAACSTGAGPVFKGLGALSLASPFVAAGVPTVVSTLWPIDDRSGGRLFVEFHKYAAAGVEPVEALRRAQLEVRRDPSLTPWAWAAVNMFTILEKP